MTDRMTARDWSKWEKLAPKLLDALEEYGAEHRRALCKFAGKRKRRSAARLKVKR